jgi:hypothetical protein
MNSNTKFPNHHFISSNKFGFVLPQIRAVIKPSQVPTTEEKKKKDKEEQSPFTNDDDSNVYLDMSFYSKEDLLKYENSPIQNIPTVKAPQGVFDVYRYLKK